MLKHFNYFSEIINKGIMQCGCGDICIYVKLNHKHGYTEFNILHYFWCEYKNVYKEDFYEWDYSWNLGYQSITQMEAIQISESINTDFKNSNSKNRI